MKAKFIYCYFIAISILCAVGCQSIPEPLPVPEIGGITPSSSPTPSPLTGVTPTPTPRLPAPGVHLFNPPTGMMAEIVVFSDRDGDNEIYIIDCGAGEIRQLTDNDAADLYPSWSQDRERVIFVSDRDGNLELYTMGADGSAPERLTENPGMDTFPVWSPDDKFIAYFSRIDGKDNLRLMNVDARTERTLADFEDGTGGTIVFSPDGKVLYFCLERMEKHKIYLLELPDGTPREIIAHAKEHSRLSTIVDPQGVGLLYVNGKGKKQDIWFKYVADGRLTPITRNVAPNQSPSFSGDGKSVIFSSQRDGDNWQIYAVSSEGTPSENEVVRITDDEFNYYYPECK